MRDAQKKLIIMDCNIMINKLGDIPFDLGYEHIQREIWNIAKKYGITGPEVVTILMDNFPKKRNEFEKE